MGTASEEVGTGAAYSGWKQNPCKSRWRIGWAPGWGSRQMGEFGLAHRTEVQAETNDKAESGRLRHTEQMIWPGKRGLENCQWNKNWIKCLLNPPPFVILILFLGYKFRIILVIRKFLMLLSECYCQKFLCHVYHWSFSIKCSGCVCSGVAAETEVSGSSCLLGIYQAPLTGCNKVKSWD